jgi:hypothetical protein
MDLHFPLKKKAITGAHADFFPGLHGSNNI